VAARRIIDNQGVSAISNTLKDEWIKQSRHQTALAMNDKTAIKHTGAAPYKGQVKKSKAVASNAGKSKKKPVQAASLSSKKHKVASGDTIVDLAKRYGVTTDALVASNNLANRHKLKLGQTLVIPAKADKVSKTPKKTASKESAKAPAKKNAAKAKATKKTDSAKKKAAAPKKS
jgi:LysM repeat protein